MVQFSRTPEDAKKLSLDMGSSGLENVLQHMTGFMFGDCISGLGALVKIDGSIRRRNNWAKPYYTKTGHNLLSPQQFSDLHDSSLLRPSLGAWVLKRLIAMMNPNLRFLVSIRGQERGITENVKHSGLQKSELFLKKSHEGLEEFRLCWRITVVTLKLIRIYLFFCSFLTINFHITVWKLAT